MVTYKCNKCNKKFFHKNDYQRHINRKTPCDLTRIYTVESSKKLKCSGCGKTFARQVNLTRHLHEFCTFESDSMGTVNDPPCTMRDSAKLNEIHNEDDVKLCDQSILKNQFEVNESNCAKSNEVYNEGDAKLDDQLILKENIDTAENTSKRHTCEYCKQKFSRQDSLKRHLRICKINKVKQNEEDMCSNFLNQLTANIPDAEKEKIYNSLLKELNQKLENVTTERDQLKDQLDSPSAVVTNSNNNSNNTTTTTTTTNNNINNNISNNINNSVINNIEVKILPYGKENLVHLTDKEYKYFINKGFQAIPELVKYIHFNKEKPENHNIYISNMRDNYVMVFDGRWKLKNKKETLDDLYNTKKDMLTEKFAELAKELSNSATRKFDRFVNDEQDKEISDGIKEELKLILYNYKNIPQATKKLIKKT